MTKVVAVFNIGTSAEFKKYLSSWKPQLKPSDENFRLVLEKEMRKVV